MKEGIIVHLSSLSISNFRQFGEKENNEPGITVYFNPTFNVLVGENDSGKTAIIDAIRYLLGSVSEDFERIVQEDFFSPSKDTYTDSFYIEGTFKDLTKEEAGAFLEWLSFDEENNYKLRISLSVEKRQNENGHSYIDKKVQAGDKAFETRLDSKAQNYLKTTYLKPLRDASSELKPGFRSRLAQILKAHPAFANPDSHELVGVMKEANEKIESFFEKDYTEGRSLIKDVEGLLKDFYDSADQKKSTSNFTVTATNLTSILKKLSLDNEEVNLGLGNLNLLFIATELLLLNKLQLIGPQITLIEEIEAHLHTQAQIRLIKYLEKELEVNSNNQFILSSHSTNLVASIDPKNIIMIHNKVAYPFKEEYTMLVHEDYLFLERFLDSTKSNLFFAKGIIFVEGDAEMLLLPALANLIGYPLHRNGISLVNVHGTSFERYVKLFSRSDTWINKMMFPVINIPIAIVTDLDIKPMVYYEFEDKKKPVYSIMNEKELKDVLKYCKEDIEDVFIENIGEEYSTQKKLLDAFKLTINEDSNNKEEITLILQKDINEGFIQTQSIAKNAAIIDQYSKYNANIETFIAPDWTLEYSLALGVLAPLLWKAVHEVRYKKPYNDKYKKIFDEVNNEIQEGASQNESTAYKMFKPLNDKTVSKGEVAQLLAIGINKIAEDEMERRKWTKLILEDEKLEYLVNAIKHMILQNDTGEEE